MWFNVLLATFLCSVVSLLGAGLLSLKKDWSKKVLLQLTAFAAGVMLSASLLHMAPEAIEAIDEMGDTISAGFMTLFAGVVTFFVLERAVLWYHHHHDHHGVKPSAWLIIIGDSIHNFIDGVAIAAGFLIDPSVGILTAIAVGVHEIPQEIADFVTMINGGMSSKKALMFNFFSALAAMLGSIVTLLLAERIELYTPYLLAFAAGMFLYISLSDLIPELHHEHSQDRRQKWVQLLFFALGIFVMVISTNFAEQYEHTENAEPEILIEGAHPE